MLQAIGGLGVSGRHVFDLRDLHGSGLLVTHSTQITRDSKGHASH